MNIDQNKIGELATSPFAIGVLGAVVALRGVPGSTWGERLFNVFSGSMLAGFLSPAIAEHFALLTPSMQSATAFVVGLLGLNIVAAIVQLIKDAKLADVLSLPWKK